MSLNFGNILLILSFFPEHFKSVFVILTGIKNVDFQFPVNEVGTSYFLFIFTPDENDTSTVSVLSQISRTRASLAPPADVVSLMT